MVLSGDSDLINALESLINGCGEAFFHFTKWVAELASENPHIPFKLLLILAIFAIVAPIIFFVLKAGYNTF